MIPKLFPKAPDRAPYFVSRDGISPRALLALARQQLARYESVEFLHAEVSHIARSGRGFIVRAGQDEMRAKSVIVATGVVDELPALAGIASFFGRSVHVCPYCDGWEHRDAPVAAFGSGAKGVDLALLLRQWTHNLVLCTDGTGEVTEASRAKLQSAGIALHEKKIAGLEGTHGCLERIVFADGTDLSRKALFFNTGQHPRSRLLEGIGCRYSDNGVICDEDRQTSIPGLYVAGDVSRDVQLAIIAAAEGARAALAINRALLAGSLQELK